MYAPLNNDEAAPSVAAPSTFDDVLGDEEDVVTDLPTRTTTTTSTPPKRPTRYHRQRRASARLSDPLAMAAARVSHLLAMRARVAQPMTTPQAQVKNIDDGLYVGGSAMFVTHMHSRPCTAPPGTNASPPNARSNGRV